MCNMSGHTISFTQVTISWEVQTSEQAFDDTGVGLAPDVLKNGADIPLVDESADRVRITDCLED